MSRFPRRGEGGEGEKERGGERDIHTSGVCDFSYPS